MIMIVPVEMKEWLDFDNLMGCNLAIILHKDRAFVYKDKFGHQRFIEFNEIPDLVSSHINTLTKLLT